MRCNPVTSQLGGTKGLEGKRLKWKLEKGKLLDNNRKFRKSLKIDKMNKHSFIKKLSYPNKFSNEYIYQIFKEQDILAFRNLFEVLKKNNTIYL